MVPELVKLNLLDSLCHGFENTTMRDWHGGACLKMSVKHYPFNDGNTSSFSCLTAASCLNRAIIVGVKQPGLIKKDSHACIRAQQQSEMHCNSCMYIRCEALKKNSSRCRNTYDVEIVHEINVWLNSSQLCTCLLLVCNECMHCHANNLSLTNNGILECESNSTKQINLGLSAEHVK